MPDVTDTISNPLISSFFWADPTGAGMTYEQLKARRALAASLAAKSRDYPNTLGKGIFSAAESIGEGIRDYRLDAEEKRIRAGDREAMKKNRELLEVSPDAVPTPPAGPAGPAAAPAPRAELDPAVDAARSAMAEALTARPEGARPAPIRMAALPSASTMSDAGQPGATYGGPSPSGPGASMAEPPDQSMPAPPASPPVAPAGAGPVGTPAPAPATGGGVPPGPMQPQGGPMGGPPPGPMQPQGGQPQDPRSMLAMAAMANKDFNPDAAGAGPGPGIPPQMLAQVGGFGAPQTEPPPAATPPGVPGARAPGLPAFPATQPGQPLPPQGQRPTIPPQFTPPTEAEFSRLYGPRPSAPAPWVPALREKYNRAMSEAMDPNRSDGYRKQMQDAATRIEAENTRRFTQQEGQVKEQITRRDRLYDEMNKTRYEDYKKRTDPVEVEKANAAAMDARLRIKSGLPTEKLFKTMDAEQEAARAAVTRQEDNQMALEALRSGAITGTYAEPRLNATKFAGWLTNNPQYLQRAGSTELLRAKLLGAVSGAIKDFKPISRTEVELGQRMVGDINLEPQTTEAILHQNIIRNNREIARYDTRAHQFFSGEGPIAETYKSPEVTWFNPGHLQRLFENPDAAANFDKRYGPGSAAMVLNRKRLNPDAR